MSKQVKFLTRTSHRELETAVNELLADVPAWRLVCVYREGRENVYYTAWLEYAP